MTEKEVRWEFCKQWLVKQRPGLDIGLRMVILRGFLLNEYKTGDWEFQIKIAKIVVAIEHDYQTFLEQEGGIEKLLEC